MCPGQRRAAPHKCGAAPRGPSTYTVPFSLPPLALGRRPVASAALRRRPLATIYIRAPLSPRSFGDPEEAFAGAWARARTRSQACGCNKPPARPNRVAACGASLPRPPPGPFSRTCVWRAAALPSPLVLGSVRTGRVRSQHSRPLALSRNPQRQPRQPPNSTAAGSFAFIRSAVPCPPSPVPDRPPSHVVCAPG